MRHYRWWIIILAFIGIIINYMDRSALGLAITPIREAFHLSNAQFGYIASAFGLGYIIMTFIGGLLVDKFGSRSIWAIAAVVWSISAGAVGFATGFGMLVAMRTLLGAAEGPAFPALNRVATDWLPIKERGRAVSLALAAVPFSSVIGSPLTADLILHFSWRVTFVILGIAGLIWSLVWFVAFRDKPEQSKLVSHKELAFIQMDQLTQPTFTIKPKRGWGFILLNPALLTNNIAFFAFGYILFFSITWLPDYLEQGYGLNLHQTGLFLTIPWACATVAVLLGGFLVDYLWRKTGSIRISRSLIIAVFQALSALSFIPILLFHTETIAIIFISLALSFGLLPNTCFYAINADLVPERAASSLGLTDCFFALACILAPWLTGHLATVTGNFNIAIVVMLSLSLGSSILVLLFQHPDRYRQ